MTEATIEKRGAVTVLTLANPPVNAIGHAVRRALSDCLDAVEADDTVTAVVVCGDGAAFSAGADAREFGADPQPPHLPDLLLRIEASRVPWIAAIHGYALGGGLELALACHHRIATDDARLGLPEVKLGLIPGAGGTVRLTEAAGPQTALQVIVHGKTLSGRKAVEAGLIAQTFTGDPAEAGMAFAENLPAKEHPASDSPAPDWDTELAAIKRRYRGQTAPVAAFTAIRNAVELPRDEALARERAAFLDLRAGPQSAALRHIFFAEKAAGKPPEGAPAPQKVEKAGVVGGGTMGTGIAAALLLAGIAVTLVERDADAAAKAGAAIRAILDESAARGILTPAKRAASEAALTCAADMPALAGCDLVIEAVFEDMEVKKSVFVSLEHVTRPDAILASNTSYLDINAIAADCAHPERVVGLHFFSPAHKMKLLEVIRTASASPQTLSTALGLARRLGKIAVLAGVCDGFIGNRIMSAYRAEADRMLVEGATPRLIDDAMTDYGFPMGIYAMQDMAGLDIAWAARKRRIAESGMPDDYIAIADRLCEAGRFGRKTGAGWYRYEEGKALDDPFVAETIAAESEAKGVTPRAFTRDEAMNRIMTAMTGEAQRILDEGIARSADDIDVVMINGYGFPRWRGGPMFAARHNGTDA